MPKKLAKAKLQSLDKTSLSELLSQSENFPETLLQNHYVIEGSLTERIGDVSYAFSKWKRDGNQGELGKWWVNGPYGYDIEECFPYRYSSILSIFDDYICFYVDSYYDGCSYFCINYDIVDGVVHIGTDIQQVDVDLVIKSLSDDETDMNYQSSSINIDILSQANLNTAERDALPASDFGDEKNRLFPITDQDDVDSAAHLIGKAKNPSAVKARIIKIAKRKGLSIPDAWSKKEQNMKVKQNDQVNESDGINTDTSASTPVGHSNDNPKGIVKPETEANSSGSSIPDAEIDGDFDKKVDYSDDMGVGKAKDNGKENVVKTALADTAAGYKKGSQSTIYTPGNLLQSSHKSKSGDSLGYVELQSTDAKKHMHIQGIATRADIVNTENQVYPLSVWQANVPKMNTLAQSGKFLGKLEHPDMEQGLIDTAIKFTGFTLQGSDVHFTAVIVPTEPYGKNLQAMIEAGVSIDLSSRGYGTVKQNQTWRGQTVSIIQDDFECVAIDAVWRGASIGSQVTETKYQSENKNKENKEIITQMEKTLTPAQQDALTLQTAKELKDYKKNVIKQSGLNELGEKSLTKALEKCTTVEEMFAVKQSMIPILKDTFGDNTEVIVQSNTYSPTFIVKQSAEELAPKTVGEMFDRMVADLPDKYPSGDSSAPNLISKFQSPRQACKHMLCMVAQSAQNGFHGPSAARALLALEQGKTDHAQNILNQSFSAESTIANANANNDGAPLSAPLIFPLIRRVFPRYIMNEVASIQPMDRPQGKIFFLDAYRTEDPAGFEKRIDLNTSANPFNSSYADNNTEGSAAELIRLRLTGIIVTAYTKKIMAQWSIEEMQDLRAYHGLDASQELMGSTAREMALEWNKAVLDDMLLQATAYSGTYGGVVPATGFPNQKDWDEYIWNYVQQLDNAVFSKRNGQITHLVCGVDAALALSKGLRYTTNIGGDNGGDMELYPGTTFFGSVNVGALGTRYKIFKTNFWGTGTTNGSKILGLRRGTEWSDTPYIWAPYTDYVTPQLTDPQDFSQKQGIASRAGKQVVVSDAMGVLTVNPSGQGAVI